MKAQDYEKIIMLNQETEKAMCENEVIWQKKSLGPGPAKLIGGNLQAGFYGEVPASDLITGVELARIINLKEGIDENLDAPWLKFSYLGRVEFIAKKPFKTSISWNAINEAEAVFGNRVITIKGLSYKVRLIKGKTEGKQDDISSYNGTINHNSEWNRLMLPIHEKAPSNWKYPANVNSPTENWNIKYTDDDLVTTYDIRGSGSWCQECGEKDYYFLRRGISGPADSSSNYASQNSNSTGWRPVLELVD